MIKRMNIRGQTALILILLTAAALVFLAITLNWGRIAQTKALITVAADESASQLASGAASYGEMQKQTYLQNANQLTETTSIIMAIIMIVVAIIVTIITWGAGSSAAAILLVQVLDVVSITMAVANLALQLAVVQPGITSMWNKLQKNQPITQQFYESGVSAALQGAVGDQVNITDYLDWNANGVYGITDNIANDSVGRFAVFYTDRLKMLNQPPNPTVLFFYNQLSELMNGESCDQNETDYASNPGSVVLNPACTKINASDTYCISNPTDPACEEEIPNVFQLNDTCADSNPASPTYNPYCDPCCQILNKPNPLNAAQPIPVRPSSCDQSPSPAQCQTNNPFGATYALLYDPTFQNYPAGKSFLAQFGRDQQMGPFTTSLTPEAMTPPAVAPSLEFPNGIYPFFWLMDDYSPEVDNIDPTTTPLTAAQDHWCTASVAPVYTAPTGFVDLTQLTLPYACQGQDCCVNYLPESVTAGVPTPPGTGVPNLVIDTAGAGANPAQDPSFGGTFASSWAQGDNQMCTTLWPYNAANSNFVDGTCEWNNSTTSPPPSTPSTLDSLDDTMHALSDFEKYAQTFLGSDAGTLSATFQTWYPQAAAWIDPASNGRLISLPGNLNSWNTVVTNWLKQTYVSANAWCLPTEATVLNGNPATAEDTYINSNSNGSATWGDLPHVIACLNYSSNQTSTVGSVYNFQQCSTALSSGVCPATVPAQCVASTLGRSLLGGAVPAYDGCAGNFMTWVTSSLTLATDEAPKFALRSAYLTDIYNRAETMQTIFPAAATAIQNFLNGPAAQLIAANGQTPPTQTLPNAVIYGWVDNTYPNGQPGHAHIVKVTAYSPGRCGGVCSSTFIDSVLPWIKTSTSGFLDLTRSYTLTDRDDYVYVSVKRWDEDHGSIFFPNGHPLWQFLLHNPSGGSSATTTGQGLLASCIGPGGFGFGLEPQTVAALVYTGITPADQTAMSNAFMLNDEGDGKVDPSGSLPSYGECLSAANALLTNAPESHACVEYVASRNALGPSGDGDADYSMKFVTCPSIPPEDLGSS